MSDPFSIGIATVGLLGTAVNLSRWIINYSKSCCNVDRSVEGLGDEVNSLSAIVESFRAVAGDGALDAETGPEADEWRKVEKNLEECNRILQELEQALQRIKKSKGSAITRKWKYDTESVNIKFYKEQIANYKVSLQISFQVLDFRSLRRMSSMVSSKLDNVLANQRASSPTACTWTCAEPEAARNSSNGNGAVQSNHSNAAGTSSNHDLNLEFHPIWIDEALKAFAANNYDMAERFLRPLVDEGRRAGDQQEWLDDAMRMLAVSYCYQGRFQEADAMWVQNFRGRDDALRVLASQFLGQGKMDYVFNICHGKVFEGRTKIMGILERAYFDSREWSKAKEVVSEILKQNETGEIRFRRTHSLAEICLQLGELVEARHWAQVTLRGIEGLFDQNHHRYYQSVNLLVVILFECGEIAMGKAYKRKLPPEYEECVEIEQLCRMEPSQAAIKIGKSLLKDILPKDPKERRSFLKTIRECRNVLGKGHEWGLLHASAERGHKLADESLSSLATLLLLEKGANIEARDANGNTALILASMNGCDELVQLLLDAGADVNANYSENLPLPQATHTALFEATLCENIGTVRLLLARGAKTEARNAKGNSALNIAVRLGYTEIVEMLLAVKDIDINAKNIEGETPLMTASRHGLEDMVRLLLEKNADVWAKNHSGATARKLNLKTARVQYPGLLKTSISEILEKEMQVRLHERRHY